MHLSLAGQTPDYLVSHIRLLANSEPLSDLARI